MSAEPREIQRDRESQPKRQPYQKGQKSSGKKQRNSRKVKEAVYTPIAELKPWTRVNVKVFIHSVSETVEVS